MNKFQEEIINAVQYIVEEKIKKTSFVKVVDGVIQERTIDSYTVLIENEEYERIYSLNENDTYSNGDLVYVVIQSNNYSEKFILGHRLNGRRNTIINKNNLPTEPVQIIRENNDPRGKAIRFNYGFEGYPSEMVWSQVLHRGSAGEVLMITNHYYDGSVEYNYLLRNEANRVDYYGQNRNFNPN